ncbi:hypothetical protein [Kocuria rhizophila]|uniref:hypothetical protein n=1 Tax=Kocuria rhizophila TaxID=72000 RepID=UPI000AB2FE65|nr:hypothetical protein [Kocuria rhizophila]
MAHIVYGGIEYPLGEEASAQDVVDKIDKALDEDENILIEVIDPRDGRKSSLFITRGVPVVVCGDPDSELLASIKK